MHHSRLSPVLWVSLIALTLLAGCSTIAGKQDPGPEIATAQETSVTTPAETAMLLPRERSATQIARFENERATVGAQSTSFALGTPYPTSPPFTPRPTRPAITPVPGINGDCANASREFKFGNCWNEVVGGEYVFAQAGALWPDPQRGALRVYTSPLDLRDHTPMEWYPAPVREGGIYITDVHWPVMTLAVVNSDPRTLLTFNLETRQWISPTLTPVVAWPFPTPTSNYYFAGEGIIVEDGVSGQAGTGVFTNQWHRHLPETVGGMYWHVFFGRDSHDPAQGIVVVESYGQEQPFQRETYRAPRARGALRVLGATGTGMTLLVRTEMGDYLEFDLMTRQWISRVQTLDGTALPGTPAPTLDLSTRTPVPTWPPATPGHKQAWDTRVAQTQVAIKTIGALTATQPANTPMPTETARSTPTWATGWIECVTGNPQQPVFVSCWQGTINGQFVAVMTGRYGRDWDIGRGVVSIWLLGPDNHLHLDGTYPTPLRQGAVRIVSIDGPRVYLVPAAVQPPDAGITPIPEILLTFDISLRQWITATPDPTHSP